MDKEYTSPRPVFVGGAYYPPGKPFRTDNTPSFDWVEIGKSEAIGGGDKKVNEMLTARNRIENPPKKKADK